MTSAVELARDIGLKDEEVVRRVLAGERWLYEVLMRRHNALVYRAVRAIVRDEDEVEDVMQQAYVAAFTRLGQFRGAARFSTWLVAVALNEARGRVRRSARVVRLAPGVGGDDAEDGDGLPEAAAGYESGARADPEREVGMRELTAHVERELDRLPQMYREVFMLRHVQGLDTAECAEALGVTADVVKTRLHRARALLRGALADSFERAAPAAFEFHDTRCDRVVGGVLAALDALG